jgi:diphthine-ammonia ligase
VKEAHPDIQAVSCGAIFSNYQRLRLEHVCARLGLVSLSFLWMQEQGRLLERMISARIDARLIKICAMGLSDAQLGKSIAEL